MAPTICTEKKRQVRSSLKDIRRQQTNGMTTAAAASSSSSGVGSGSNSANSSGNSSANGSSSGSSSGSGNVAPSSIINYVAKGAIASTLRLRGSKTDKMQSEQRLQARMQQEQQQQISDNAVSSSTHSDFEQQQQQRCLLGYAQRRHVHMDVDTDDDMQDMPDMHDDYDEADSEVHSINSASSSSSTSIAISTTSDHCNGNSKMGADCAALLQCVTPKSVFPAPALSDKQLLPSGHPRVVTLAPSSGIGSASASSSSDCSNNKRYNQQHSSGSAANSDTYSNMCELKNTEGLLAIALKTIKLVKRNQLLQRRLAQLQLETSEFIQSVLANPENRHFRDKIQSSSSAAASTSSGSVVASVKSGSPVNDKLELEWGNSSASNSSSGHEQHVAEV